MNDLIFPQPKDFDAKVFPLLGGYFYNEIISKIDNSRSSIYSVQYQWKWNIHERFSKIQMLGSAISRARQRKVEVNIILNTESPSRNITKINSVSFNRLNELGCNTRLVRTTSILHTKLWIIDKFYTFIGSHNISTRSMTVNEETSVLIESSPFAHFMLTYFYNLWGLR